MTDGQFEDIKTLWNEQKVERVEMIATRQLESGFRERVTRRNWLEWVGCAIVLYFFGAMALSGQHVLVRAGAMITCLSAVYVAWRLLADGRVTKPPNDHTLTTQEHLERHRDNLRAQATLLRKAPLWYVAPIFAGWSMIWVGSLIEKMNERSSLTEWFAYLAVNVSVFAFIAWFNVRGADKLDRQADELI